MTDHLSAQELTAAANEVSKLAPKIYDDALAPGVRRLSTEVELAARALHVVLAPVRALVWGAEQVEALFTARVAEKLAKVPAEEFVEPPLHVVGPAYEALRYTGHDEVLREMYASLIAAAVVRETTGQAHPAFVEIIKQMTATEARFLAFLRGRMSFEIGHVDAKHPGGGVTHVASHLALVPDAIGMSGMAEVQSGIGNLNRLGLTAVPPYLRRLDDTAYEPLRQSAGVQAVFQAVRDHGNEPDFRMGIVEITMLGIQFVDVCASELPSRDADRPTSVKRASGDDA